MVYLCKGKITLFISALMILVSCSTGYAPVRDLSSASSDSAYKVRLNRPPSNSSAKTYKVKLGDTLYSIAWKYGHNFKALADFNAISGDYTIYQGQVIKINLSDSVIKNRSNLAEKINISNKSSDKSVIKKTSTTIETIKKIKKAPKKAPARQKKSNERKINITKKGAPIRQSNIRWQWPAKGKVVKEFSNENKGLDLSGRLGESVYAAASGIVVYAGNGIIGYGNLIIIKHSEEFLSAYAHNSVIFIKEKSFIKAGEKIAEIGSSGTTKTVLHFEIRKDGKPVNPIKYLPEK